MIRERRKQDGLRFFLCLIFFLGTLVLGFGQESGTTTPDSSRGTHEKQFFRDPNGRLYVARSLPIYFRVSSAPSAGNSELLKPESASGLAIPVSFSEGLNVIKNPTAFFIDSDDSLSGPEFEVWADGTPPYTQIQLTGAPRYLLDPTLFFGVGLNVNLNSEDNLSGVKETFLSINQAAYYPYEASNIDVSQDGSFSLRYYSVDNVGNVADSGEMKFIVDTTPPKTTLKVNGIHRSDILSSEAKLELTSLDSSVGIANTYYALDQENFKIYEQELPINNLPEGEHQCPCAGAERHHEPAARPEPGRQEEQLGHGHGV